MDASAMHYESSRPFGGERPLRGTRAQAEGAQAERAQAEGAQAERAQAEGAQAERAQAEGAQAERAQAERSQTERAQGGRTRQTRPPAEYRSPKFPPHLGDDASPPASGAPRTGEARGVGMLGARNTTSIPRPRRLAGGAPRRRSGAELSGRGTDRAHDPRAQGAQRLQPIRFGDFLIEKRAISEGQLLDALAYHWQSRCRLGEAVVARGYLSGPEMERLLGEYHALRTVDV